MPGSNDEPLTNQSTQSVDESIHTTHLRSMVHDWQTPNARTTNPSCTRNLFHTPQTPAQIRTLASVEPNFTARLTTQISDLANVILALENQQTHHRNAVSFFVPTTAASGP